MKSWKFLGAFLLVVFLGVGLTGTGEELAQKYSPNEKEFYLTEAEVAWLRPGLKLTIQGVEFAPPNVYVTFRIADDQDQPLDRLRN